MYLYIKLFSILVLVQNLVLIILVLAWSTVNVSNTVDTASSVDQANCIQYMQNLLSTESIDSRIVSVDSQYN